MVLGEAGMRYKQIFDGEWTEGSWTEQRDMCCHCGLVHITEYKVEKGKIWYRTRQSERATKQARKKFKFERN